MTEGTTVISNLSYTVSESSMVNTDFPGWKAFQNFVDTARGWVSTIADAAPWV
jgi:hypothetical protein